ncbi:type III-B CRISPR module RAMP protein Cmr4 [Mahella sp.]|uniref:type III-B CRISPR module RAMP protein Cmr4 n=1 Tax=Mahella sp. TaxID=2798721 RepID=UPI0025BC005A|nr:type III-B CRISPR module RAMP protein Cmr4 [Mahella sp.]MBZ4664858.1 CRISPR-associated protein Cmr4 family [Mahella sp.]
MNIKSKRIYLMAIDPIHIGTGGYSIGRVDNAILRELGTNLPIIPGSTLIGTSRSYAAVQYGKPEAAGLHKNFTGDKNKCPILYTFGTANKNGEAKAGKIKASDARICFFPGFSNAGPLWVTTKEILGELKIETNTNITFDEGEEEAVYTTLNWDKGVLKLGWLALGVKDKLNELKAPPELESNEYYGYIKDRITVASPKLFPYIVDNNLETRTSVAINPQTGAAEDKALFTYEAIPRSTWFWCDVIEEDYENSFPSVSKMYKDGYDDTGEDLPNGPWKSPMDVFLAGLNLAQYFGIGGMSSKGFGRIKRLCRKEV